MKRKPLVVVKSKWFLGSLLAVIALGREDVALFLQTLGVVAALSFATVCTGTQWVSFEELVKCDKWAAYDLRLFNP